MDADVTLQENGITALDCAHISAVMEAKFAGRGLAKSVSMEVAAQEARERETQAMEPVFYRLSGLSEGALNGLYRRGRETMNTSGLLHYFEDMRAMREEKPDLSLAPPSDNEVYAGEAEKSLCLSVRSGGEKALSEKAAALPAIIRSIPERAVKAVQTSGDLWFNASPADTKSNRRRFPVSAFAAIIAVAMSLFLIVAGSVMVHSGESRVNGLTRELSALSADVGEIRSELDVKTDLLAIRRVATEEYGMVGEEYVRMDYLSGGEEESIEVYETKEENELSLGALLSAIGLR